MLKNNRGFTSIEILVVLMISASLIVIWAVSKNSQIKAAYLREADVFFTDIINKQRIAHNASSDGKYYDVAQSSLTKLVGGIEVIDGRKYLYFNEFKVTKASTSSFVMTVYGKPGTVADGVKVVVKYDNGQRIPLANDD